MSSINFLQAVEKKCIDFDFPLNITNVFSDLKNNTDLVNLANITTNRFQNYGNDLLMDLIHASYFKNKKIFNPIFRYDFDDKILLQNEPRLFLGLHSNVSPIISALMNLHHNCAVVSDFPKTVRRIIRYSSVLSGNLEIIKRDETCLLNIKKFLQNNYSVASTIDFRKNKNATFNLLSDSLFKLAIATKSKTYFGLNSVNDNGEIVTTIFKLDLNQGINEIKKDIIDFITVKKKNSKFIYSKFDYHSQKKINNSILN